ncbi:hypothetical protein B0H14DRAFT_2608561 [Mycena olivaceomarginata]|nr:hypothetical protein B0H14DRAFT_2608561 [Mycena olivaceomarginata]
MSALNAYQLLPEEENLIEEELEVYGIDWQGLRDDGVLQSQAQNNSRSEGSSSWVGYTGPPPDLSEVIVQPPQGTLTADEISHSMVQPWLMMADHGFLMAPNHG